MELDFDDARFKLECSSLHLMAFKGLMEILPMNVDLFLNPWNAQLKTFINWKV
jgi:hypothetical protein